MVALLRLNLFVRVIIKGWCSLQRSVFAARGSDKSWLKAIERDLAWMATLKDEFKQYTTTEQWIQAIAVRPNHFKI